MENEKIKIGFTSTPDFSGNSKALYEKIKNNNIEKFDIKWFVKDEEEKNRLRKLGIKVVSEKDEQFEEELNKIQIMFITHDQYMNKKRRNQIFISLWHGFGPKRTGLLTKGRYLYEYESVFARKYADVIDYILVQSEFAQIIFNSRYECGVDKLIKYPYPRNEYLIKSDGKRNLKEILNLDVYEFKKIIMYAPTFRKGLGRKEGKLSDDNLLNLKKYNEKELNKYLEENNYLLLLQLHPSEESILPKEKMGNNIKILNSKKMIEKNITINELMNAIDLMITDYSSIYMDYLLLNRPLIFLNTDYKRFKEDRGILFENEDFWFPGPKVDTLEKLKTEINVFMNNSKYYKDERRKFSEIINGKDNNNYDSILNDFILKLKVKNNIPQIIHYIKSNSKKDEDNIKKWKEKLEDYQFIEWDLKDSKTKNLYEKYNDITLFKLSVLYEYGGIFIEPSIQILNNIDDLCINSEYLFIIDKYGNCITDVIGASKNNKFVKECLNRKWYGINNDEEIFKYNKNNLFLNVEEQYEFCKNNNIKTEKYFNNSKITIKNKIGRALKYGFNI